ncbi:MAG: hypothetical protein EHM58_11110 [Ignavibacteriae bacterium]|nr:MAG: hypothetical protein EHM58_11110 [Ignavibacteriota bacterium]
MRKKYYFLPLLLTALTIAACGGGSYTNEETTTETTTETTNETTYEESQGAAIINVAQTEQQNEMYSPKVDTTYLYWINKKIVLKGATKCNIYALNILYKAGFKTPAVNALTKDLVDTSRFKDIFPVVGISEPESARKGDLIIWNGHVIIFESIVKIKNDIYALAWWSGTRQADNGDNIINNVCYGKYKLNGYYVVRRPLKKSG